jgi:L-iditol 2-dehydrogenase
MRSATLTALEQIELTDAPAPSPPGEHDVLLDVLVVGVCGSDMHYYRTGRIGEMVVQYPFRVGHEFSGRVRQVGSAVTGLSVGERVAVDPLLWCDRCDQCLAGREHTCRNQTFLGCPGQIEGCLCDQIVMPAKCCTPVPETVSDDQAALAEPFSIGIHTQRLCGDIAGQCVAILGAGPIGLCTAAACRVAGAKRIYMTDIRPERVAFAEQYADWTGNPQQQDIVADILQAEPDGLAAVVEASGEQEPLDQGVDLLAPGGRLVMVGIPATERVSIIIDRARRKELTLQNVRRQLRCVEPAIEWIADGRVQLDAMMTHHYTLDDIVEACDVVANYRDGVIKAMIRVNA